MAFEIFLRLKKVKGEAQADEKGETIDLLDFGWGGTQSGTTHMGSGGGGGKADIGDLIVTKWVDKATATLFQFMSLGTHIESGELEVRKAGGTPMPYLTIRLKDIIVTSVSLNGGTDDDRLSETATLNFRSFYIDYKPQDSTGTEAPSVGFAFDIAANKAVPPQKF